MDNLKEIVIALDLVSYNASQICVKHAKIPKDILKAIEERTSNCRDNMSERIYWIYNDIWDYPTCPECGKRFRPRFHGWKYAYKNQVFCSMKCLNRSDYHKDLCCDNRFERTGYRYSLQNPEHKEKLRLICQEAHGVDHFYQSEKMKQSSRDTCLVRYGVESSAQVPEFFEKSQRYRTKQATLPSGKMINFQGYEIVAITELLKTYSEEDIILGRKDIPKFRYVQDEKEHIYFADIYIPADNLIIEVKSAWTWKKYLEKNLIKQQAVLDAGFNYEVWICNEKEVEKIERFNVQTSQ